ncbi:MAG: Uma2 family endonuclease [Deltaproteobacteria bacterium]|nr:Uma2 family endonuclease [Deltaproteobacteria bacterium]
MAPLARKLATYDDLLGLPNGLRAEVVRGQVVTSPAPLPQHSKIQRSLGGAIGGPFDDDPAGPGGWWIFLEVDVRFGAHDILRPDLSGWRRERLANPAELRPIDVTPDWVCEILSPSTAVRDRVEKRTIHADAGVPFLWMVDPWVRTLEAFTLERGHWLLTGTFGESATARIAPFDAIELPLSRLFLPRQEPPTGG